MYIVTENSTPLHGTMGQTGSLREDVGAQSFISCDRGCCVGVESSGRADWEHWKKEVIVNVQQRLCFGPVA